MSGHVFPMSHSCVFLLFLPEAQHLPSAGFSHDDSASLVEWSSDRHNILPERERQAFLENLGVPTCLLAQMGHRLLLTSCCENTDPDWMLEPSAGTETNCILGSGPSRFCRG